MAYIPPTGNTPTAKRRPHSGHAAALVAAKTDDLHWEPSDHMNGASYSPAVVPIIRQIVSVPTALAGTPDGTLYSALSSDGGFTPKATPRQ